MSSAGTIALHAPHAASADLADGASVTVEITAVMNDAELLVPIGMATPHGEVTGVAVEGGAVTCAMAASGLGLGALLVRPTSHRMTIRYGIDDNSSSPYPDAAFRARRTPYTVAAAELAHASAAIAAGAGGGEAAIAALAADAQARFSYGHPEIRFNDGCETVPYLACGRTEGSCVDINTYFVASLRAAGFEAAYLYGYFFPAERGGITNDMHCWVVTRHGGAIVEWDIAHHMKAGLGTVRPGLNPRPGRRVAIGHSMGHRYALPGGSLELKLLAEPMWVRNRAAHRVESLLIRIA